MNTRLEDVPSPSELGVPRCSWLPQPCDLCGRRACGECPDCAPEDPT